MRSAKVSARIRPSTERRSIYQSTAMAMIGLVAGRSEPLMDIFIDRALSHPLVDYVDDRQGDGARSTALSTCPSPWGRQERYLMTRGRAPVGSMLTGTCSRQHARRLAPSPVPLSSLGWWLATYPSRSSWLS